MRKTVLRVLFCGFVALLVWCCGIIRDQHEIKASLIRFHVIANSDSEEDQKAKLRVRDAVLSSIGADLARIADIDSARIYIQENLPKIQKIANETLKMAGVEDQAVVDYCREAFDTRKYNTFSLPAGVYESLKIVIGDGEGKNWWCISFPGLCIPATSDEFKETAVSAGFSETQTRTLAGDQRYQVRFYLLDMLGQLETFCYAG